MGIEKLTTIICVTMFSELSPPITVLSKTPLVQNVRSVLGETLKERKLCDITDFKIYNNNQQKQL